MKLIFFLSLLMFWQQSYGAITNINVDGVSRMVNEIPRTAYGGFAGPDLPANNPPANNCELYAANVLSATPNNFQGCNINRVNLDTIITISFIDDSEFTGRRAVAYIRPTTTAGVNVELDTSTISYNSNNVASVSFTWRELCSRLAGTVNSETLNNGSTRTSCSATETFIEVNFGISASVNASISDGAIDNGEIIRFKFSTPDLSFTNYIYSPASFSPSGCTSPSANADGLCDFEVQGSDESFRIVEEGTKRINSLGSVSGTSNSQYIGFYFWFNSTSYQSIDFGSPTKRSALVRAASFGLGNTSVLDNFVDGLVNDQIYFVKAGIVDEAGNISHITGDSFFTSCGLPATSASTLTVSGTSTADLGTYLNCPYVAIPSEVAGLLEDDLRCFIATATYGSPWSWQLRSLRQFRDQTLKTFYVGRQFIDFYYSYGPDWARWIHNNPSSKAFIRFALTPLVLEVSLWNTSMSLWLLIHLLLLLVLFYRKHLTHLLFVGILSLSILNMNLEPAYGEDVSEDELEELFDEDAPELFEESELITPRKSKSKKIRKKIKKRVTEISDELPENFFSSDDTSDEDMGFEDAEFVPFESITEKGLDEDFEELEEGNLELSDETELDDDFEIETIDYSNEDNIIDVPTADDREVLETDSIEPTASERTTRTGRYISHPDSSKGLYRIKADGTYLYKSDRSPKKYGIALRGGLFKPETLQNSSGTSYSKIYGADGALSLYADTYWKLFSHIHFFRLKLASGLLYDSGSAQYSNPALNAAIPPAGTTSLGTPITPGEEITLVGFPNSLGLILELKWDTQQWIVPYVTGGLDYYVFLEYQGFLKDPKLLGSLGAHGAAGVQLGLNWLSSHTSFVLDSDYGINKIYLSIEYRYHLSFSSNYDLTSQFIHAGLGFEF